MNDPLQQFKIHSLIPIHIGGIDLSFTNSALCMLLVVGLICAILHVSVQGKHIIPTYLQIVFEKIYSFITDITKQYIGPDSMNFFPLIFTLFLFIAGLNSIGLIPGFFTVTSQIIVTFALALLVFLISIFFGIVRNGMHFFSLFVPKNVPFFIKPFLVFVEILSFCFRPISLGVRLFANMVAGHVILKLFASFSSILIGTTGASAITSGMIRGMAILPTVLNCCMFGFEVMVALLQAYVFALLSCIYIRDTLYLH